MFKLAIKRLGSQSAHWYDGPIREHPRKDIENVFNMYYNEAINSGFKISDYIPQEFVPYNNGSNSGYSANNGWSSK